MQTTEKRGTLRVRDKWILCECGAKLLELTPKTRARALPLFCRHCKRRYTINIDEAGVLETTAQ